MLLILVFPKHSEAADPFRTLAATPDEQRLIERIKDAVMKELREGSFLQEQVEIGIRNFIRKQE